MGCTVDRVSYLPFCYFQIVELSWDYWNHTRRIACDISFPSYCQPHLTSPYYNCPISKNTIKLYHYSQLLKSPAATCPLLEEPIRIIPQPSLQRILLRLALDPAPVVLPEIGIIHEERSVHIGQQALVDVLLDQVAHPLVQVLVGLVDLLVVGGKGVGEVQLDEDVVCVCGDVEEVLLLLVVLGWVV